MDETTYYQIASDHLERRFELRGDTLQTISIGGRPVRSCELRVLLDSSQWRFDIEGWRWTVLDDDDLEYVSELASRNIDASCWESSPHLHVDYHAESSRRLLFRTHFSVPYQVCELPIVFGLGGLDDEDWEHYRVFLDGSVIDEWSGIGRWREPRLIRVGKLQPDRTHVLAVDVHGLQRRVPDTLRPDSEHFFFRGWLVDQFIAAGDPFEVIDDFKVSAVRETSSGLECDLHTDGLDATLTYEVDRNARLRKLVALHNARSQPMRVLDVVLEDLRDVKGAFGHPTKGGRGLPILTADLFLGIEHPAGLNQGEVGRLRATQLAGQILAPDADLVCSSVVVGRAPTGTPGEEAFRDYIYRLRPRRRERLTAYSALGWTDFTNDADPLPHLTEPLLEENIEAVEELRRCGVDFDVYMLDDWWDPGDFRIFDRGRWPSGSAAIGTRLHNAGLGVGVWSATTRAVWNAERYPGIDAAIAGGVTRDVEPAGRADRDPDELFLHTMIGEKRFCWAAEPFRTAFRRGLVGIVRDVDAAMLKLDCAVLHCTSSEHGHAPGRYSVHALMDAAIDLAEAASAASPDLFLVWYWGFESPWWLRWGDLMFDKGLKLEAASPASTPAATWREGVSLNLDQAVRHARLIPLQLQDSLGVWIGDVAWCNRMGTEGWREALLLDLGRGSALISMWGDLGLLDRGDRAFLAGALKWQRLHGDAWCETREVGGDPWRAEPYGYVQHGERATVVTAVNPGFDERALDVEMPSGVIYECYPCPGFVAIHDGGIVHLDLRPWEVRVVEVLSTQSVVPPEPQRRLRPRASTALDLSGLRWKDARIEGTIRLPEIGRHDIVAIGLRLHRDGVWHYHPEPQALFAPEFRLGAGCVRFETVPRVRSWNGQGAPWVLYELPAGPSWSSRDLETCFAAALPPGLEIEPFGVVYNAWWDAQGPRFAYWQEG